MQDLGSGAPAGGGERGEPRPVKSGKRYKTLQKNAKVDQRIQKLTDHPPLSLSLQRHSGGRLPVVGWAATAAAKAGDRRFAGRMRHGARKPRFYVTWAQSVQFLYRLQRMTINDKK